MAKPRSELSSVLHDICENVYFQPPTGTKIKYPCIVYSLNRSSVTYSDDSIYNYHDEYSLQYITRDPDDSTRVRLMSLPYCSIDRFYVADNLYHYTFRIYI